MTYVLYADILFFVNFSMDLIALYLTSRLTSGPPTGVRSALSAALGGIYGTAATALGADGFLGVASAAGVAVLMMLTAFGFGGVRLLLRRSAVFWGVSALLGGAMTALCSLGGGVTVPSSPQSGTALLFVGSTLCLLLTRLIARLRGRRSVRIRVSFGARTAEFDALCDSGNLAVEPMSGDPVIIADRSVLRRLVPELCTDPAELTETVAPRVRMIPIKGVGGDGLLTGFIPETVSVIENGRARECEAVIAVSDTGSTFFGGYPANVPSVLLR